MGVKQWFKDLISFRFQDNGQKGHFGCSLGNAGSARVKCQGLQNFQGVHMASPGSGHPATARHRRKFMI